MSTQNIIKKFFNNVFIYHESKQYDFSLSQTSNEAPSSAKVKKQMPQKVFDKLSENLQYMKVAYNALINSDVVLREFKVVAKNKSYKAFLIYIDGMSDTKIINDFILKPLMMRNQANTYDSKPNKILPNRPFVRLQRKEAFKLEDYIYNSLLPQNDIKKEETFEKLISDINSGNCALFIDTLNTAFSLDVKGFKARSISTPNNEVVIRGSQEAFVEVIRTNTSIIRRLVNNENLVIENLNVGKISQTKVAVCYLKNIANDDLIAEVKFRINNLDIDSLVSSRATRTTNPR